MDNILEHGTGSRDLPKTYLDKATLIKKVIANDSFFVPNKLAIGEYLHIDRHISTGKPDFLIPVGDGYVQYKGREYGKVNDRPIGKYQEILFPDEYGDRKFEETGEPGVWKQVDWLKEAKRKKGPEIFFGGFNEAFKRGKTVLDIGSGQALAILQLALKFPKTSFIGLDILYHEQLPVFLGEPGVQLTKGDWRLLEAIPDKSIDTLLSCQGIGAWGLPWSYGWTSEDDGRMVIGAWERVAKPGATLRLDATEGSQLFLQNNMDKEKWEVQICSGTFIAKRKD